MTGEATSRERRQGAGRANAALIGLFAGLVVFGAVLLAPSPSGLSDAGWRLVAVAALMAIWWATEALPIAATALLPLVLFPLLDIAPVDAAAAGFGNPLIFLFLGGFLIAIAMERWHLDKRIAFAIVRRSAHGHGALVFGFMLTAALLSMWVSNTATAMMLLPIALSVLALVDRPSDHPSPFARALLLGLAYGCTIGGMGTLIGTPPNGVLAAFMRETYGFEISFARWLLIGLPVVVVMLPVSWFMLTRVVHRLPPSDPTFATNVRSLLEQAAGTQGPISAPETRVALIFGATALGWVMLPVLRLIPPLAALSDTAIAIAGALMLFIVPPGGKASGRALLEWQDTQRIPWGVLLLFGGGLALADGFKATELSNWIGQSMEALHALPPFVFVLAVTAVVIFLTELTSNTATAATFLPVVAALATGLDLAPIMLAVPAALAASAAFMLPVATPPNAIVFGSGHVHIPDMVRAGIWLNLIGILVIGLAARFIVPWVFG